MYRGLHTIESSSHKSPGPGQKGYDMPSLALFDVFLVPQVHDPHSDTDFWYQAGALKAISKEEYDKLQSNRAPTADNAASSDDDDGDDNSSESSAASSSTKKAAGSLRGSMFVTKENAQAGLIIQRGPDWKWGDQDGGDGCLGRLMGGDDGDSWAKVKWDHTDSTNSYRIGTAGRDLKVRP